MITSIRFIKWQELIGKHFHYFTVKEKAGKFTLRCVCDCGKEFVRKHYNIGTKGPVSCGCMQYKLVSQARTVHGHSRINGRSPTYSTYRNMLKRCYGDQPIHANYRRNGIKVCRRWKQGVKGLSGFQCFLKDMGERPSRQHSIERIHNKKGYCPSNCKWATGQKEQCNNASYNIHIKAFGKSLTPSQWPEITGLQGPTIRQRVQRYGWTAEEALTIPSGYGRF